MARRIAVKNGIDPDVFERQIEAESNFDKNAVSRAGARGIAQFIPSTAQAYGVNLNDGKAKDDLQGAARYLRKALDDNHGDYKAALSVYNSGSPTGYLRFDETRNYVAKILNGQDPVPVSKDQADGPGAEHASPKSVTKTVPGIDNSAARRTLKLDYLSNDHDPNALLSLALGLRHAQDTPATTTSRTVHGHGHPDASPGAPHGHAHYDDTSGKVTVSPGADRAGVSIKAEVVNFVGKIAGTYGKPLTIGTGTNHNQFVIGTSRESDHWTGHAADIPATGAALTRLGQAALITAGMASKQAHQAKGGVYNLQRNGHRIQILFNTHVGGDHFTHLHVGIQ